MSARTRTSQGCCSVDGCPAAVPIPTVFALLNQKHAGEGQPEQDYAALNVRADACIECGSCEAQCLQHLHIRKLLKEVAKALGSLQNDGAVKKQPNERRRIPEKESSVVLYAVLGLWTSQNNWNKLQYCVTMAKERQAFYAFRIQILCVSSVPPDEQAIARKNLLEYCKPDTCAMVKVWEALQDAVK